RLDPMRQALYATRRKRKQPLLDTKILTSWNALMIRAFAVAGQALGEERYVAAAQAAARFLLGHHLKDGALIRTSRADARSEIPGFLDDYAFTIAALLAVADATGDASFRRHAHQLAETMNS